MSVRERVVEARAVGFSECGAALYERLLSGCRRGLGELQPSEECFACAVRAHAVQFLFYIKGACFYVWEYMTCPLKKKSHLGEFYKSFLKQSFNFYHAFFIL